VKKGCKTRSNVRSLKIANDSNLKMISIGREMWGDVMVLLDGGRRGKGMWGVISEDGNRCKLSVMSGH